MELSAEMSWSSTYLSLKQYSLIFVLYIAINSTAKASEICRKSAFLKRKTNKRTLL